MRRLQHTIILVGILYGQWISFDGFFFNPLGCSNFLINFCWSIEIKPIFIYRWSQRYSESGTSSPKAYRLLRNLGKRRRQKRRIRDMAQESHLKRLAIKSVLRYGHWWWRIDGNMKIFGFWSNLAYKTFDSSLICFSITPTKIF